MTHGRVDDMNTIKLRVPTAEKFIHRVLISCAQSLWKQPYLFYHAVRSLERQYNRIKIEEIIKKQIETTLRNCLPLEQILSLVNQNVATSDAESSEPESEEASEEVSEEESELESSSEDVDDSEESDVEITHIQRESDSDSDEGEFVDGNEDEEEECVNDEDESENVSESESESENESETKEVEESQTESEEKFLSEDKEREDKEREDKDQNACTIKDYESDADADEIIVVEESHDDHVVDMSYSDGLPHQIQQQESVTDDKRVHENDDVKYFESLVNAIEETPVKFVSDDEPERKSIEIHTLNLSSSEDEKDDSDDDKDAVAHFDGDRKVIPLRNMLINERKFHRPKMLKTKAPRVSDAFF